MVERATWREVSATENAGRTPKGHLEVDTMQLSLATEGQMWERGLKGTYGMKVPTQQNLVNLAYGEEKPVSGRCQSSNTFPEPSLPHHTREDSPVSKRAEPGKHKQATHRPGCEAAADETGSGEAEFQFRVSETHWIILIRCTEMTRDFDLII